MKILLVAMSNSIHTARWMRQINNQGWDVRLFPSINHGSTHPLLNDVPIYNSLVTARSHFGRELWGQYIPVYRTCRQLLGSRYIPKYSPQLRWQQLLRVIDEFQPDIIHSLEFQAAGYLTAEARRENAGKFPPWIVTNWGSDIYWFRQYPEHEKKIRDVLAHCDYYSCECQRDVCLAEAYGFKGKVLPVFPNTGGFDLQEVADLRRPGPASTRRIVMLKGYQHWVGRAMVGLAALEQCVDLLCGYEVIIHSPSYEMRKESLAFSRRTGIKVTILPPGTSHRDILKWYGQARVALGLSLSDGISTSFLEGLVMGAFPVQSWTACADEWIEDGRTGLLVPPEDSDAVAHAIRRALTDDELVDQAAEENWRTARERLDHHLLKQKAVDLYATVAGAREK